MSVVASRPHPPEKEVRVITIGIDPHTRTHSAAALDEGGRVLAEITVGSDPPELDRLVRWVEGIGPERIVAVEGARGFGLALCRRLLAAGETVLDVAPALTASERRSGRKAGKDDRGDAVAVARIAMREPGLPRVSAHVIGSELKLLVDARDQLVAEATRTRNRLHALLLAIAPGYHQHVRDLTSSSALLIARRLAARARADDRLLSTCGVGPLMAAKILGEVRDVGRFSSVSAFASYSGTAPIPASSGTVIRHRLHRGGNRQLNRALHTVALTQARRDDRAKVFLTRKRTEGKTPREARRALKRHLASAVYRALLLDAEEARSAAILT